MNNIFEGAKFGDKFLTKSGKPATLFFIGEYPILVVEDLKQFLYYSNNGVCLYFQDSLISDNSESDKYDIVSRYQEPIDEEKLDKLANDYYENEFSIWEFGSEIAIYEAFIAGYYKAKEK